MAIAFTDAPQNPATCDISETRQEKDLLGVRHVPMTALYGVQTLRAMENLKITDIPLCHFSQFGYCPCYGKKIGGAGK